MQAPRRTPYLLGVHPMVRGMDPARTLRGSEGGCDRRMRDRDRKPFSSRRPMSFAVQRVTTHGGVRQWFDEQEAGLTTCMPMS
jgi:hypothetical protein